MNSLKFKTKDQTYDLKFNYKCFRMLATLWQLISLSEVFQKIESLSKGLETLEFDAFSKIADMVHCGIASGESPNDAASFDQDEFCEYVLQNIDSLTVLFKYLNECLPRQSTEAAKIPATKSLKNKLE